MTPQNLIKHWNEKGPHSAETHLKEAFFCFGEKIKLASSLGAEDQVLTHMAIQLNPNAKIFVLNTGRLHPETLQVLEESKKKYGIHYEIYEPNTKDVQELVAQKGPNSFYESVENRKECCHIRKVEPLKQALKGTEAWITGLRKTQSTTRTQLSAWEWDEGFGIVKINPLIDWTEEEVWAYIKTHNIPYNSLHDKGYPSIGCEPCTRAIQPGEDIRAGRWWWESQDQKECGLHVVDGKLIRKAPEKQVFE